MRIGLALALALIAATPAPAPSRLQAPKIVADELSHLVAVQSVAALPKGIRDGSFTGTDGQGPHQWALAEPGAPFMAGDNITDPNLPTRQLVFAACDPALCVVHYRRGGSGEEDIVLALAPANGAWNVVWYAAGHPPLRDLAALGALLSGKTANAFYVAGNATGWSL